MKSLLILSFVFCCLHGGAQSEPNDFSLDSFYYFYVLDSDTVIGKHTDHSLCDGSFRQYRKQRYKAGISLLKFRAFDGKELSHFERKPLYRYRTDLLLGGHYKNGQKWGKWTDWYDYGTDYSYCIQGFPKHLIEYKKDTVVYEDGFSSIVTTYIRDSAIIYGVFHNRKTNFRFSCADRICIFIDEYTKKEFARCPQTELHGTIWLLKNELYRNDKRRFRETK